MLDILAWHGARFEYDRRVTMEAHAPTATASSSSTSTARCSRRAGWRGTSILRSLKTSYGWKATRRSTRTAGKFDFSGKTDPQIVRELVIEDVGRGALRDGTCRARSTLYLEELERQLTPETVVPKPGISELLERLAAEPRVTLGAADRQPRARRAAEARAARLQPLLPVRRLRQRLGRPVPAAAGRGGARARAHGPALRGQVGRGRRRFGPRRGLRPVDRRARRRGGDRDHEPSSGWPPRGRTRSSRLRRHRARARGDPRMRTRIAALLAVAVGLARRRRAAVAVSAAPAPGRSRAPYDSPPVAGDTVTIALDMRAARADPGAAVRSRVRPGGREGARERSPPCRLAIRDSNRPPDVFEHDLAAAFDEQDARHGASTSAGSAKSAARWEELLAMISAPRGRADKLSVRPRARAAAARPARVGVDRDRR